MYRTDRVMTFKEVGLLWWLFKAVAMCLRSIDSSIKTIFYIHLEHWCDRFYVSEIPKTHLLFFLCIWRMYSSLFSFYLFNSKFYMGRTLVLVCVFVCFNVCLRVCVFLFFLSDYRSPLLVHRSSSNMSKDKSIYLSISSRIAHMHAKCKYSNSKRRSRALGLTCFLISSVKRNTLALKWTPTLQRI